MGSFLSRKIVSFLMVWALKVDINLLNQHCKPADWLADWLTYWLRHLGAQGTQGTRALEHLRHSKGTWALGHSMYSKNKSVLRHSGHSSTWGTLALGSLRCLGTQRALEHSNTQGTWALEHSKGTWAMEVLETFYLADSIRSIIQ